MKIERRTMLASGGALAAASGAACVPTPDPDTTVNTALWLADAHTHLFNVADLPAGRFVQYVVVPAYWPGGHPPPFIGAILDLVTNVAKRLVILARYERVSAPQNADLAPDVSRDELAAETARRILELDGDEKSLDQTRPDQLLLRSYDALAAALAEEAGVARAPIAERFGGAPLTRAEQDALAAEVRALIILTAPSSARAASAEKLAPPGVPLGAGFVGKAVRLLGWVWLMMQRRQSHLATYLEGFRTETVHPKLVVHHLVDYDEWLGDAPLKASGHDDQIRFWGKVSRARAKQVELRTFAGYCPLKHAIERTGGRSRILERLEAHLERGDIAGVKVYPPMGFRASGNARIATEEPRGWPAGPNGEFASVVGAGLGQTAVERWRRVAGSAPLGKALDEAMDLFLDWAAERDVPLMAHAGSGNQAGPRFGLRANPRWWEEALRDRPTVRLSLGHLVSDPCHFVKAVCPKLELKDCPAPSDSALWALDAPIRMLAPRDGRSSNVWGDLGYMPELVQDPALAEHFFLALRETFGKKDPDFTQILYGTDWIMLAMEPRDAEFPGVIAKAMENAGLSKEARDNIRWYNARRFLKLPL